MESLISWSFGERFFTGCASYEWSKEDETCDFSWYKMTLYTSKRPTTACKKNKFTE